MKDQMIRNTECLKVIKLKEKRELNLEEVEENS